jgi:prepilin-type N-terminal cleavage/methylation domain-containing protein
MSRPAPHKAGFTLLEIIVSISILALMALMISRIFNDSTRAVEQGKGQSLIDGTARLLLDYIEQDVSQALIRTNVAFRVQRSTETTRSILFLRRSGASLKAFRAIPPPCACS